MYKRQARIVQPISLSLSKLSQPLNIIIEEEESRASSSSSRSTSPMSQYASSSSFSSPTSSPKSTTGAKARRRHANVSDIRIVKDFANSSDSDLSPLDDMLLIPSRPAPSPPACTQQSPEHASGLESVDLTFTDVSYRFPLPPVPTSSALYERPSGCHSPALSSRSESSCSESSSLSPRSQMPLTPSTSEDEFSLPTRTYNPRRAAIQPLVVVKSSGSFLHPLQNQAPKAHNLSSSSLPRPTTPVSPASSFLAYDSSESDSESDSEFYHKEFASFLTLRSPLPPHFPHQQISSRPESMAIGADDQFFAASPLSSSRALSVSPVPRVASKRSSRRISIPKYPPPPPPVSASNIPSGCPRVLVQAPRPPPRSSIPADFSYDVDEHHGDEDEDAGSAFSFSMYEIDFGDDDARSVSRSIAHSDSRSELSERSLYSQPSQMDEDFPVDDVKFDMDMQLMLPLSLPNTPLDLEHDIAMGLEELRAVETLGVEVLPVVVEESYVVEDSPVVEECPVVEVPAVVLEETVVVEEQSEDQHETVYEQDFIQDIFTSPVSSPTPSSFSFGSYYSGSPCASPSPYHTSTSTPAHNPYHNPSPALKSKWSTSTLGSIREEHERRSAPSKLRLYFNSHSPIKSKRGSGASTSTPSTPGKRQEKHQSQQKPYQQQQQHYHQSPQQVPSTPSSPFYYNMMSPRKASRSGRAYSGGYYGHGRQESGDVMVIGQGQAGVRRRPSVNSVSDAGSEESSSSTSSSGLRRKPIPVEMFLRSAVAGQ